MAARFCEHCGTESASDDQVFCEDCGEALPEIDSSDVGDNPSQTDPQTQAPGPVSSTNEENSELGEQSVSANSEQWEPLLSTDPEQIDDYQLLGRLGAGGFGVVYSASDGAGRQVALKVLRPELSDDTRLRRRLSREATALRRVRGDRTAEVIDVVTEGDRAYLVMELVEGQTLDELVENQGPLQGPLLWFAAQGLISALQDIHSAGIVHRDLKPSNVMLGPEGIKVVDFGISVVAEETSLTQTGAFMGTEAWISPEQILGSPVTEATDVFNFGLVMGFAATGEHIYGEGRSDALMYRISNLDPDVEPIAEPLRSAVRQCLQRNPQDRPSVAELGEFLGSNGGTPLATPSSETFIVDSDQLESAISDGNVQGTRHIQPDSLEEAIKRTDPKIDATTYGDPEESRYLPGSEPRDGGTKITKLPPDPRLPKSAREGISIPKTASILVGLAFSLAIAVGAVGLITSQNSDSPTNTNDALPAPQTTQAQENNAEEPPDNNNDNNVGSPTTVPPPPTTQPDNELVPPAPTTTTASTTTSVTTTPTSTTTAPSTSTTSLPTATTPSTTSSTTTSSTTSSTTTTTIPAFPSLETPSYVTVGSSTISVGLPSKPSGFDDYGSGFSVSIFSSETSTASPITTFCAYYYASTPWNTSCGFNRSILPYGTYYVRYRLADNQGRSDWSLPRGFTVAAPAMPSLDTAPTIVVNGQSPIVSMPLKPSGFDNYGKTFGIFIFDSRTATDINSSSLKQTCALYTYSVAPWGDNCYPLSMSMAKLAANTSYYVRYRLEDKDGRESWSQPTSFVTPSPSTPEQLEAPTILSVSTQTVEVQVPPKPSGFDAVGTSVEVQIFTSPTATDIFSNERVGGCTFHNIIAAIEVINGLGRQATNWNGSCTAPGSNHPQLNPGTTYYARYRYAANWGHSMSDPTAFTTSGTISNSGPPEVSWVAQTLGCAPACSWGHQKTMTLRSQANLAAFDFKMTPVANMPSAEYPVDMSAEYSGLVTSSTYSHTSAGWNYWDVTIKLPNNFPNQYYNTSVRGQGQNGTWSSWKVFDLNNLMLKTVNTGKPSISGHSVPAAISLSALTASGGPQVSFNITDDKGVAFTSLKLKTNTELCGTFDLVRTGDIFTATLYIDPSDDSIPSDCKLIGARFLYPSANNLLGHGSQEQFIIEVQD